MKRRYREKPNPNQIVIASVNGKRIHDFLKGWGTICKDGSILWDWWKPVTKRQQKKFEKKCKFDKFIFPVINKILPEWNVEDFINCQSMTDKKKE